MRYAVLFLLLAAGCVGSAVSRGGPWWLATWPAAAFGLVAACYGGWGPGPLGKRADGTIGGRAVVLLLPYFLYAWGVWRLRQAVTSEPAANEVADGVWVGRRPSDARELPPGTAVVVDLAAEFPAAVSVRSHAGYLSVPTLDGTATDATRMAAAVRRLESAGAVAYIHCAFGHGRSAALAAAVLVRRGLAPDVPAAEALMRCRRPGIRLKPSQRAAAAAAAGDLLNS